MEDCFVRSVRLTDNRATARARHARHADQTPIINSRATSTVPGTVRTPTGSVPMSCEWMSR